MNKITCSLLLVFAILVSVSSTASTWSSGWSPPMKVKRIDLHPDWKVRVLFDRDFHSDCPEARLGEWSDKNDEVFMDRVLSALMMAKASDQTIRVWVSGCPSNIGQFNQTRLE